MADASKLDFKREIDALTTIRDELKVKAHLAKADVKDELSRLERKWERIEEELRRTSDHAKEPLEALSQSSKELLNELKQGYNAVKSKLV